MEIPTVGQSVTLEDLKRYFGKMGWPEPPSVLVEEARRHGAPEDVVAMLGQLPNRVYMSAKDVLDEYQAEIRRRKAA